MEKLFIALCDDISEALDALEIATHNCKQLNSDGKELSVDRFSTGEEFLKSIRRGRRYDLIFMDIRMPDIGGDDVIKMLPVDCNSPVIFATSYTDNWPKVGGFIESGFLVKPFSQSTFDDTVRVVLGRRNLAHHFEYSSGNKKQTVVCSQIRYFAVLNHKVKMYTVDKTIQITGTKLKNITEELEPHGFFLCNRSFLINFRFYHDRTKTDVLINTKYGFEPIPLSREKATMLDETYIRYKLKGEYAF